MKKSNTFVIKLVNTDDFYLKCTYLAIGPIQNLYFRLKDMIFWHIIKFTQRFITVQFVFKHSKQFQLKLIITFNVVKR